MALRVRRMQDAFFQTFARLSRTIRFSMLDPHVAVPLFTLGAAALFGASANVARTGLDHVDSRTGAIIAIGTTVGCYLVVSPLWMRASDWSNPGLLGFAGYGLIHPWLSRYMAYEANRRVGATISATFEANSPLLTIALAMLFLGERPTVLIAAGTLMTVAGMTWIYWDRTVAASIMRAAALLALGAMALRALLSIVAKVGLEAMPNPVMGAFATYAVSLACALCFHRARAADGDLPIFRKGAGWFVLAGVFTGLGTLCLFSALLRGQVMVVAPILASYPLFTMLIAAMLRTEALGRHTVIGVAIAVTGVALVSLASGRS